MYRFFKCLKRLTELGFRLRGWAVNATSGGGGGYSLVLEHNISPTTTVLPKETNRGETERDPPQKNKQSFSLT